MKTKRYIVANKLSAEQFILLKEFFNREIAKQLSRQVALANAEREVFGAR